jgi:hypothetical protein
MNEWIDIKNSKLKEIIRNCEESQSKLILIGLNKKSKNWKAYKFFEQSIAQNKKSIDLNESKRK